MPLIEPLTLSDLEELSVDAVVLAGEATLTSHYLEDVAAGFKTSIGPARAHLLALINKATALYDRLPHEQDL